MDPRYSCQDVVCCTNCEAVEAPMYCNVCHIHLCNDCVENHLADKSKVHIVVSLKQFLTTPKCSIHLTKQCDLHCEQCDTPICTLCLSAIQHKQHDVVDLMDYYEKKRDFIRKDLEELENSIYPKYEEVASNVPVLKSEMGKHSEMLSTALNKHGEIWHKEINDIIQTMQSKIDSMNEEYITAINAQENEINYTINEISKYLSDIKKMLNTSDIDLVSKYKSRNEEFKKLPAKLKVTFPYFQPQQINRRDLSQQFGTLCRLVMRKERDITLPPHGTPCLQSRPLLDIPHITRDFATGFEYLYNVACLNDKAIWTRGDNSIIKLYNLQGELLTSVETKSGNYPRDITVIPSGDLVYIDYKERSINVVNITQIQPLITLLGWRPLGVCVSKSSGDFLVIMTRDDNKQSKVVRYSGATEKQHIQWDDQNQPLYSSGDIKYICENQNLDICVADNKANAVVVVNAEGKLRFVYKGATVGTKVSFCPYGITTDSQRRILSTDWNRYNYRIHILDQTGKFLRYIENCGLWRPLGLCVDSKDNLFVAERDTGKVKKIQFCK